MNIVCERCGGEGFVKFTGVFEETLRALERHDEINATALAREVNCSPQAMWNRLVWLESRGLAESRSFGRMTYFRAKTHAAELADKVLP